MPVIAIKKETVNPGHSFWVLVLPYEAGDQVRVYGQTLGEALANLANEVKLREKTQRVRDQVSDQVEAA